MTRGNDRNTCAYWDCNRVIPSDHFLCGEHYEYYQNYLIDQCPSCGRFKNSMYELCLDCYDRRPAKRWQPVNKIPERPPNIEHSNAWNKRDTTATRFFVYVLSRDNGKFYVGQTRELRERLSEHKDGKVASTAGMNPKLKYFEILPTREVAEHRETELKQIAESNPREIRRMIISLRYLVSELRYE